MIYLFSIIISSLILRLVLIPYELPIIFDGLLYFWYANDISVLGELPSEYTLANSGWSIFLSLFFKLFESNNFLDYMILQRVLSSVLSTLTIIPVYFLCKKFFDNPFPIIGALIFAFEPHLILNSTLGITEPLFILLTTLAIVSIIDSRKYMNFLSFAFAACSVLVRSEGIILFLPLTILFFINCRHNKKEFLYYPILCLIFVIILMPITLHNIEITGNDGFVSRVISETKVNENNSTVENNSGEFLKKLEQFFKMYGWSLIPSFVLFVPVGLFNIIKKYKFDHFRIIILFLTTLPPAVYSLSFLPDTRYSYFTFPILIIISIITIKSIHSKYKNRNLILFIITGVLLLSSLIFIEFKKTDIPKEIEISQLERKIVEYTQVINQHLPNSGYLPIIGLERNNDFPIMRNSFEQNIGMEYCIDVHSCKQLISINSENFEDYFKHAKMNGLTHVIINEDNLKENKLFEDIFENEENFDYLNKVFDSTENGFSYKLKIFEIDYTKIDLK